MRNYFRTPLYLLFASCLFLFSSCDIGKVAVGAAAPDFMLSDLDGKRFYLSEQKGNIILLNFWSVHCMPCIQEMPHLQERSMAYKEKKVLVVGICTDREEAGYIQSFLQSMRVNYPVLLDSDNNIVRQYGVTALPTTYIIDGKGMVAHRSIGYFKGTVDIFQQEIDTLRQKNN